MSANTKPSPDRAPDSSRILIIDFGGQYTQLIARRVREAGVYSEILPYDADPADIEAFGASGIVLSGGPESVSVEDSPRVHPIVFALGVPILGICYGMQALAAQFGGKVAAADHREFGFAELDLVGDDPLLGGLKTGGGALKVWMSHGDRVEALPPGFRPIAASANAPLAAMADVERRLYGVQFHPEVTHTEHGLQIIRRFAIDICGCPGDWTPGNIIAEH
ncbi:MAG TPA: glutamine-hydrolyzing GMP synthase, partial [Gammaproteobacteria bacterium]|nr:glutamine-hydrolyzing GMP synthase [Gammaproteobacteria bacterium]